MINGQMIDRAVEVTLGGRKRRVYLCLWGLIIAEEQHGYDISSLDLDAEGAERRSGVLRQMLELLWIGMLPYEPDLTIERLGMEVSFDDLPVVTETFNRVVGTQLTDDIREKIDEGAKKKSEPET